MNWEMLAAIGQLAAVFVGIPLLLRNASCPVKRRPSERQNRASKSPKKIGCMWAGVL